LTEVLELYSQIDNEQVLELDDAKRIFYRMKEYPDYNVYVALVDGVIVGTFALAIMDNLAHLGSKSGLIEDVVVSEQFRGRGIGKQMMAYAVGICREKQCYKVCLSSNLKRHDAHKFYEKIGFRIHGYSFLVTIQ